MSWRIYYRMMTKLLNLEYVLRSCNSLKRGPKTVKKKKADISYEIPLDNSSELKVKFYW